MRDFPIRADAALREQAETYARGGVTPASAALASTVMLVRSAAAGAGVEVFLQRRVASMAFAPSMIVFPGGRVDPRDAREDVEWAGRPPLEWAATLGTDVASARLLVTAAIRELFEESGVLLAGPDRDSVVENLGVPMWQERRDALIRHEISLAEVLAEDNLILRADLLAYRAHWMTPEFEPRRYDTRFFAASVPMGQTPDGLTSEAEHAGWASPATVLADLARREVRMMPPTVVCLEDLADAESVDEVVADASDVRLVLPELVATDEGMVLRSPIPSRGHR